MHLKEWRKRLGLTQSAAAEALGVTRVTLQRLEKMETLDRRTELACAQIELKIGDTRDANLYR